MDSTQHPLRDTLLLSILWFEETTSMQYSVLRQSHVDHIVCDVIGDITEVTEQ